ncbi:MAG: RNA polymerase sigma factor [Actinomycetota bacterium]
MVSRELLEACRRRDPGAFEELVELTHRQVYTLALRLVGDRHEAEDVAQDAYLRAYRALRGFRGDARFETWLYRIVSNVAMTHLRRRGRFGDLLAEGQELPGQALHSEPDEDSLGDTEVKRALSALPDGQRVAVVLKDVYGFSCQEIADQLGVSEGAVKVRLHRARRRLKDLIYGAAPPGHEDVRRLLPDYAEEGAP